jgi:hypothetical protein
MLKTKFLLMFLTLNGLLLGANSAFAYTSASLAANPTGDLNLAGLSHTIADLIDLDGDAHSLVEMAINRALIAKSLKEEATATSAHSIVNSKVAHLNSHPIINGTVLNPGPIINGTVPNCKPIINGKIVNPHHPPIINGIIKYEPPMKPVGRPLINGVIINPNSK